MPAARIITIGSDYPVRPEVAFSDNNETFGPGHHTPPLATAEGAFQSSFRI
jgi:hypothetical protein